MLSIPPRSSAAIAGKCMKTYRYNYTLQILDPSVFFGDWAKMTH